MQNGCRLVSLKFVPFVFFSWQTLCELDHRGKWNVLRPCARYDHLKPNIIWASKSEYDIMSQTKKLPQNIHFSNGFGTECVCFSSSASFTLRQRNAKEGPRNFDTQQICRRKRENPRTASPNELHKRLKKKTSSSWGKQRKRTSTRNWKM